MTDDILRVTSRRRERVKRMQTVQHLAAAVTLISAGWSHLGPHGGGYRTWLAAAEVGAGVLLVVSAAAEKILHKRGVHTRIGWVEIAGAAMTLVEAINRLYEPHHTSFRIVSFIPPVILLTFGLFDFRLSRLPHLRATDKTLVFRSGLLFRRSIPWEGIHAFSIADRHIVFEQQGGRRLRMKIADIAERDSAVSWLREQLARRGVEER